MKKKSPILAIGGIDPCSGAGLNVDTQIIANLGLHPLTIPTILTAQNPHEITEIKPIEQDFLEKQFDNIKHYQFSTIKVSLFNDEQISFIAKIIQNINYTTIIYDPIIQATTGTKFLTQKSFEKIKNNILTHSNFFCPNFDELEILFSINLNNEKDIFELLKEIYHQYQTKIYLKGGHKQFHEKLYDYFYNGNKLYRLYSPKYEGNNSHGSGCRFSTALACYLDMYSDEMIAVEKAKNYISNCFSSRDIISTNLIHLPVPQKISQHSIQIKSIC